MKRLLSVLAPTLFLVPFACADSTVSSPCSSTEIWKFSAKIPEEAQDEYKLMLHTGSVSRGFAEAMALRRVAVTEEAKRFAEYWAARALFKGALPHVAYNAFASILASPRTSDVNAVQLAALGCLNDIEGKFASITAKPVSDEALTELLHLVTERDQKDTIWLYTLRRFLAEPTETRLSLLKGAGSKELLAQGVWAARQIRHADTKQHLEALLSPKNTDQSGLKQLDRYMNHVHLLLARAYYSLGSHEKAFAQYKLVSRNSNELATALSELAWSALMTERYREAAGTAMTLQVGGLRNAFAPEAIMVMAMAMNELCQYPSSLQAIELYKKTYEPSYKWLSKWSSDRKPLYPVAVDFLRKKSDVPARVGTEWVRSPLFLASQEEMNLLLDEKDAFSNLSRAAAKEQREMGREIKSLMSEVKSRVRQERGNQRGHIADADAFKQATKSMIDKLKKTVVHYKRYRLAATPWRNIAARHQEQAATLKKELVKRIETDLSDRSRRMLSQMDEILENNQLIEVEIYNGASQDIIWQNAHPDYKEMAQTMDANERGPATAEKNWSWGSIGSGEHVEIWEDELGSFAANVFDNCSNKERFLAIKTRK